MNNHWKSNILSSYRKHLKEKNLLEEKFTVIETVVDNIVKEFNESQTITQATKTTSDEGWSIKIGDKEYFLSLSELEAACGETSEFTYYNVITGLLEDNFKW